MLALKEVTTGPLQTKIDAFTPIQNLISMASSLANTKDWELAASFQDKIGPALTAIVTGINNAITILNKSEVRESLYDTGFATGQDFGEGVVAGLLSMIVQVQAAAARVYGAAKPPQGIGNIGGPRIGPVGEVMAQPVYQSTVNIAGNTFVGGDNATIQLIASLVEGRIMSQVTRLIAGRELATR